MKHALPLTFATLMAAALALNCAAPPPTQKVSPRDWDKRTLPAPPVTHRVILDRNPASPLYWSPDSRYVLWQERRRESESESIVAYAVADRKSVDIEFDGMVHMGASEWLPQRNSIVLGVSDQAPLNLLVRTPLYAERLVEYDLSTGQRKRDWDLAGTDCLPTWTKASNDGNTLLVLGQPAGVERSPLENMGPAEIAALLTPDGPPKILTRDAQFYLADWDGLDAGLLYRRNQSSATSFLGFFAETRDWMELVYAPVSDLAATRVISQDGQYILTTRLFTGPHTLRYEVRKRSSTYTMAQWQVWDYDFDSGVSKQLLDLLTLFLPLYEGELPFCRIEAMPDRDTLIVIGESSVPVVRDLWIVLLKKQSLTRFDMDLNLLPDYAVSPDGLWLAAVSQEEHEVLLHSLRPDAANPESEEKSAPDVAGQAVGGKVEEYPETSVTPRER